MSGTTSIPSTLPPKVYKSVEGLCRTALMCTSNHQSIRTAIANLCFSLEQQSNLQNNQLTIDVLLLKRLLKKSDPRFEWERPEISKDPITELASGNHPQINSDQGRAAIKIRDIWGAFQKFLTIAARSYDGKSGKKNKVIQPLDVMDEELFRVYREVYTPWFERACRRYLLDYKKEMLLVSEADVCIAVIVEFIPPQHYDVMRGLPKYSSIIALKKQLDKFNDMRKS